MADPKLERLAATQLTVDLPEETLAEAADLVLRLHQQMAREHGAILAQHMTRTYTERTDAEQLGMRSAVQHVLHALLLLDVVELRR